MGYSPSRGTLPLTLFGPGRFAVLMGRLALPSLLAQAIAPSAGAFVLERFGAGASLCLIAMLALVNVVLVVRLWSITVTGAASLQ